MILKTMTVPLFFQLVAKAAYVKTRGHRFKMQEIRYRTHEGKTSLIKC